MKWHHPSVCFLTMDPYFERPRLCLDENPHPVEIYDPYTGSPLSWRDRHFEDDVTVEDRMCRSMDSFCASVDDDFAKQSMSLSAVETGSASNKRVKNHVQRKTTAVESEEKDHAAILKTKFLSVFTNVKNGRLCCYNFGISVIFQSVDFIFRIFYLQFSHVML